MKPNKVVSFVLGALAGYYYCKNQKGIEKEFKKNKGVKKVKEKLNSIKKQYTSLKKEIINEKQTKKK